jgi:glutamine---fructose-6-phosphate transaminase (isomerizing)
MSTLMQEIAQQPSALADLRKFYSSPGAISHKALRKLVSKWPPVVVFTGMGSSLYAAYPAQAFLTALGFRALVWETAELLHHHLKVLKPDTLVVVVSQSGETVEVTELLKVLPPKCGLLGVVNVEASTLARRAKLMLPMMAGHQSTVSTKTYMASVTVLMYLAFALTRQDPRAFTHSLMRAVEAQHRILEGDGVLRRATMEFFNSPAYVALMSRGPDLASVYQGALTLKEVVRMAAEATSAAQFRHGPIEIVNPAHRYVIFARQGPPGHRSKTAKFLVRLAEEIRSHSGRVLLLTDLPFESSTNMRVVEVEPIPFGIGTLIDTLHIQLLAHDLAVRAGLDPGKLWIAEEVTKVQ